MLNGGWNLDFRQIKEMRDYHQSRLALGWKEIKPGNIRTRYKITEQSCDNLAISIESFYTVVCFVRKDKDLWTIMKNWDGYSSTTMRGINLILEKFNAPKLSKKKWQNLEYRSWSILSSEL